MTASLITYDTQPGLGHSDLWQRLRSAVTKAVREHRSIRAQDAYRNRVRVMAHAGRSGVTRRHGDLRHGGGTALLHRPGEAHWARDAEHADMPDFRHKPVLRHLSGWSQRVAWGKWRRITMRGPQPASGFTHAISLFIIDASNTLDFWYVDLVGPMIRTPWGFDFTEHGIDIVAAKDFSAWQWKDEDELEHAVMRGSYTREEVKALKAEGEFAVARLSENRRTYEEWINWRPQAAWPLAQLPHGWQEL